MRHLILFTVFMSGMLLGSLIFGHFTGECLDGWQRSLDLNRALISEFGI